MRSTPVTAAPPIARLRMATLLLAVLPPAIQAKPEPAPVLERAAADDWQTRWAAVRELAALAGQAEALKLRAALLRHPQPRVREAIAWACLLDKTLGDATLLGIALKRDKDAAVRRAAARALIHHRDRRAVSALIAALARETDTRTRLRIVTTLRGLTPAPCLLDAADWQQWWQRNAHDPRFEPADAGPRTTRHEGVELETRTVVAVRKKKATRKVPHLLVLPPFGWRAELYGPAWLPLRRHAAVTFVRLPNVQKLTGRSGYGDDIAKYPVARLVNALERFRRDARVERFVVVAHGASGWFAMRYAKKHSARCAALIFVDTALDKQAYAESLQRAAARGTSAERFAARTLMRQNSVPFTAGTLARLHRGFLNHGHADPADLASAWHFAHSREAQGFATVPDIAWAKTARIETPALFLYSGNAGAAGHSQAGRIRRHFPHALVAPIKECRAMPWLTRNDDVHRVIDDFFVRYKVGG